jgi:hypothetical protein
MVVSYDIVNDRINARIVALIAFTHPSRIFSTTQLEKPYLTTP